MSDHPEHPEHSEHPIEPVDYSPFPTEVPKRTVPRLPKEEGYGTGGTTSDMDQEVARLKISQATSLADLIKDGYKLFHHGLMFRYGSLETDPVRDYLSTVAPKACVFEIGLPQPLVFGLGDLGYKVYGVDAAHADSLFEFLGGVGAVNRSTRFYWRTIGQVLQVPDILFLAKQTVMPTPCPQVEVLILCVDSNYGRVSFLPAQNPPFDIPKIIYLPTDPDTLALAQAVLKEDVRPLDAIDPWRREVREVSDDQ